MRIIVIIIMLYFGARLISATMHTAEVAAEKRGQVETIEKGE